MLMWRIWRMWNTDVLPWIKMFPVTTHTAVAGKQ